MSDPIKDLLDMIGGIESAKGYNYEYGNKPIDLENMTLDEVLTHQQDQRKAGADSSAVGRYQFIYKTLEDIVRRNPNDFPRDAKFTPEMQDKAALVLLGRRGLKDYMSGQLPAVEFGRNLSKEWASLPDPSTGRSYYDGDGLNHSLTDVQSILGAITKIAPPQTSRGRAVPASYKKP